MAQFFHSKTDSFFSSSLQGGLLALAFFITMTSITLLTQPFELDGDEGFNLMKALLLTREYFLYRDIWSDQPPVFSLMLQAVFQAFGNQVDFARLSVAACSGLLLWGSWNFLRTAANALTAHIGVVLLVLLPYYAKLSISSLIGLPALAFAVLAMAALAHWQTTLRARWLLASALLIGISICTKAFTIPVAAALTLGLLLQAWLAGRSIPSFQRLLPILVWGIMALLCILAILAYSQGLWHLDQLIGAHSKLRGMQEIQDRTLFAAIKGSSYVHLLFFLAAWGAYLAWCQARSLFIYPVLWLALACISLWSHRPVWFHLTLLVTIPLALLASLPLAQACTRLMEKAGSPRGLQPAVFFVALLLVTLAPGVTAYRFAQRDLVTTEQQRIMHELMQRADRVRWIFTDRPIYAFRAGLPVPPQLAVVSWKRNASGNLDDDSVLETLKAHDPEIVLLVRWRWPLLDDYLQARYRQVDGLTEARLYVRKGME